MQLNHHVEGHGAPLIMLHGFLGSLDNFRTVSKPLTQSHTVYTLDLRNHGRSPHTELMNYPLMAEDVVDFMTGKELMSASLLGHSMGGKIAMQIATSHPGRVSSLVVVDIAPREYRPAQSRMLESMARLDLSRYRSFSEIDAALGPDVRDPATRRLVLKNIRHSEQGFYWKINLPALMTNYVALTRNIEADQVFHKPALFIRGGKSKYIQDEDVGVIRELFPLAEIVLVPEAGHWIHAEAPQEFVRIVENFLKRTEHRS